MRVGLHLLLLSLGLPVVAGSCARALAQEPDVLLRPLELLTSCGHVLPRADQSFEVPDSCFRAVFPLKNSKTASLSFTYLGATEHAEPLASGEVRQQVGLKLRAQDTCNVVYVMWHIAPDSRIEVSVKHNPGQSEHKQCGDKGYRFLKAEHERAVPPLSLGSQHVLKARLHGTQLSVEADAQLVWQGRLPAEALMFDGPIGVRSDNAHLLMQLHAKM